MSNSVFEGILPLNKQIGKTSFHMVSLLRRVTKIKTIGHAGTLDPFAGGVLILLIGKPYTKLSSQFLNQDKEYKARLKLGVATDTFDLEGQETHSSFHIPTLPEIESALSHFQGSITQIPPMFSAKKVQGQTLYTLARKGITIERAPIHVQVTTTLLDFTYPFLDLHIACSKGTYIRSIADDLGKMLGTFAHLTELTRLRSGSFTLDQCCPVEELQTPSWTNYLCRSL